MASIKIQTFDGVLPQVSSRLLPDTAATISENARLDSGRLAAWKVPAAQTDHNSVNFTVPSTTRTIYKHRTRSGTAYWLAWTTDVHVVASPIAEDPHDRIYWTGQQFPRMSLGTEVTGSTNPTYAPSITRKLGVPQPTTAPTVSVTTALPASTATALSRAYISTWVSGLGEESGPSPASSIINVKSGETVTITLTGTVPSHIYNITGKVALRRIYRTGANGDFQFVKDIAHTLTSTTDAILDENLGEIIPTTLWDAPPDETTADHPDGPLLGLTAMPNGIVAGFTGRSIFFSEAFIPHAFPRSYSLTTKSDIVGLASISIGLLVLTQGKPVLITGSSPASMSAVEIDNNQACVSGRSIADMGEVALYASPDGIVAAGENGVSLVTDGIFSRDQWQALDPTSIHGYHYEGRYIFFWLNGANSGGYVFDGRGKTPMISTLNYYAKAGFNDPVDDALYLVITESTTTFVRKFDAGAAATYTWQSKEVRVEKPINPSCAIVDAEAYPVTFTLYADGVQKHTRSVTNGSMFRLPAGYMAKDFQFRLSGSTEVNQVLIAESPEEFQ